MMDIFSSFDPYINSSFQYFPLLFWFLVILGMFMISSSFWMSSNQVSWIMSYPLDVMSSQSLRTLSHHIKGFSTIIISLFVMIIIINFMGLLPYGFTYSSHMVFSLMFGLPLWLSLVISSAVNSPSVFVASLLPGGAPDWLNPFLILVETISIMVRPVTLSVRLVANMAAGHIVLSLIGIYASSFVFISGISFLCLMFIQVVYVVFEMGICLIQAYIFCLLLTLYADEHS